MLSSYVTAGSNGKFPEHTFERKDIAESDMARVSNEAFLYVLGNKQWNTREFNGASRYSAARHVSV